jgi:hypothetical protein
VPLPRPSRRKRKWGQRQLVATLERAKSLAAATDLKPVSARSKPAVCRATHVSMNFSVWFDSPVQGRFDLGPCLPKHVASELLCFLM